MKVTVLALVLIALVASGTSAEEKWLRGVFRDPNDGRPVGMWVLESATRKVQLLDAAGKVVGAGVLQDIPFQGGPTLKNTAKITVRSGAIYYLRWEGREMRLYSYAGKLIDASEPSK